MISPEALEGLIVVGSIMGVSFIITVAVFGLAFIALFGLTNE